MNYLKAFQELNGLDPDGFCGPKTAQALMEWLDIKNITHFIHFISQVDYESGGFRRAEEDLGYSKSRLLTVFPGRIKEGEASIYAYRPIATASRVYGNRLGNGGENTLEGWIYRGRGAIQITGKFNYQSYFKSEDLPLDSNPDILLNWDHFWRSAKWFFDTNDIWLYCDKWTEATCTTVSKIINIGNPNSLRVPAGLLARQNLGRNYSARLLQMTMRSANA